jgi:hypothetical protein
VANSITVCTFNAVGAMPTDRSRLSRRMLHAAKQDSDLLVGCECDDLEPDEVDDILGPGWWFRHRQHNLKDGTFLAGRLSRTRISGVQSIFGAPASPVNDPRYFLRGFVHVDGDWSFSVAALHVPRWKEGGSHAATEMVRRSQEIGTDLLGGDFNIRNTAMRARYPRRTIRSAQVLHLAARKNLVLGAARPFDVLPNTRADDHPGLRVKVAPRTRVPASHNREV